MARYFNPNVDQKDRKRFVLGEFRGVDTANPIYAIDKHRASAMRNIISVNGANHKRPGWRQVARFLGSTAPLAINGYFSFKLGGDQFRIVYAANNTQANWYQYNATTGEYTAIDLTAVDTSRFVSRRAQMVMGDDKVFFYGFGDILAGVNVGGNLVLRNLVDGEDATIPVTTVNIDCEDDELNDPSDNTSGYRDKIARQTNREPNILTRYRTNTLLGSSQCSNSTRRTYKLDTDHIDDGKPMTAKINVWDSVNGVIVPHSATANVTGSTVYTQRRVKYLDDIPVTSKNSSHNAFDLQWSTATSCGMLNTQGGSSYYILEAGTFKIKITPKANSSWNEVYVDAYIGDTSYRIAVCKRTSWLHQYAITWDTTVRGNLETAVGQLEHAIVTKAITTPAAASYTFIPAGYFIASALVDDADNTVTWAYIDYEKGTLEFIRDISPAVDGSNNIEVTFAVADPLAEEIRSARFGSLFGANGTSNVLVLGGIEGSPNVDYMSQAEDFTYFPSGRRTKVGTPNTAIKGYMRLGDNSLAILKEPSSTEPSLYIRTGAAAYTKISDDDSSIVEVVDASFQDAGKYITKGAVCEDGFGMLDGDALFVAKDGVYGIDIGEDSVAAQSRVSRLRSRFISRLLARHDLSTAASIVYDDRFYLAVDGYVYIADSRYRFKDKADAADTYNYEWWMWDGCPVRDFYEIDGELCFGTEDGRLCVFDNQHTDRKWETATAQTISYDTFQRDGQDFTDVDGAISLSGLDLTNGEVVQFKNSNIVRYIGDLVLDSGVGTKPWSPYAMWYYTKFWVTADGNALYLTVDYDHETQCARLYTEDGTEYNCPGGLHRFYALLDDELLRLRLLDDGREGTKYGVYSYKPYDDEGDFARYSLYIAGENVSGNTASFTVRQLFEDPVKAEWVSPAFDMGSSDAVKELMRITLATQSVVNGAIQFGYETKGEDTLASIDSEGLQAFDFGNLAFDNFSFDTGFSSAFTKRVKAPFNYILFRFVSDNAYDSCVNTITAEYRVKHRNKGVF